MEDFADTLVRLAERSISCYSASYYPRSFTRSTDWAEVAVPESGKCKAVRSSFLILNHYCAFFDTDHPDQQHSTLLASDRWRFCGCSGLGSRRAG